MSHSVWPSDPRYSTGLSIRDEDIQQLRDNKMLMTRLLDYLLQRGLHSARKITDLLDFEFNICCGSTDTGSIMASYNHSLEASNLKSSRATIASMRKKMSGFASGRHKFVFPHVGNLHFFVIVITHDASIEDPWLTVECYNSLRPGRNRNKLVHQTSEFGKFLHIFATFWNNFIWYKRKDKREVNFQELLQKGTVQPCPQQQNGIDCGLFAVSIAMYDIDNVPVSRTTFSQQDVSALRRAIVSACDDADISEDITRNARKYLSRQSIRCHFFLLRPPSESEEIEYTGQVVVVKAEEEGDSDIEVIVENIVDEVIPDIADKPEKTGKKPAQPAVTSHPKKKPPAKLKTTGLSDDEEDQATQDSAIKKRAADLPDHIQKPYSNLLSDQTEAFARTRREHLIIPDKKDVVAKAVVLKNLKLAPTEKDTVVTPRVPKVSEEIVSMEDKYILPALNKSGKEGTFENLHEVEDVIQDYERQSGMTLGITRSDRVTYRNYICKEHVECSFF